MNAIPKSDPSPEPIVALQDIHLRLPSAAGMVHILNGINLSIEKGAAVGLVGPSGSGKSSLMAVIAGLERPTSGEIHVAGADIGALNEDQLARFRRDHVGIVFQAFHLIPTMTALENVAVPLELAGTEDAFDKAETGLRAVGLGHRLSHYPAQLSGGEQQRVALARAVALRPDVVLADEPTGNLDTATGQEIVSLLFGLHETFATTLILITHDDALAAKCDFVVRLNDGQVAA